MQLILECLSRTIMISRLRQLVSCRGYGALDELSAHVYTYVCDSSTLMQCARHTELDCASWIENN